MNMSKWASALGAFFVLGTLAWAAAPVTPVGDISGGSTGAHYLSAANNNSTNVKTTGATLYGGYAVNTNAATAYLKFYSKATAPTCASDTITLTVPLVQNIPVSISLGPVGVVFPAGLGFCITGAAADNDNTSATTGITFSIVYK
jgi:hypothetical protein